MKYTRAIIALLALGALALSAPQPGAHAQPPPVTIDQMSIDMDHTGNGIPAAGGRGDSLNDAEGTTAGVCGVVPAQDDDGDTTIDDGCPSGPATVGTPEMGLCGNGVDDDPYKPPLVGPAVFDGVPDDGCMVALSTLESCAEVWDDDILNADEDIAGDLIYTDVTVGQIGGGGVPASRTFFAFA